MDLTTAAREMHDLNSQLKAHIEAAKLEEARLRNEIRQRTTIMEMSAEGIDFDKVALAKTIIYASEYSKGGDARASVVADAIKQLSTGVPVRDHYGDLWRVYFGTKSYDRWHGQRSDHEYGYGPGHGSTIFSVGIVDEVRRNRTQADLTPEEVEAAIYYLVNLTRIQTAEAKAREASLAA